MAAPLPVVAIATGTLILGSGIGLALGWWFGSLDGDAGPDQEQGGGPPAAVVEAETVTAGSLPISYETLGTLRAAERVELRPIENGQVEAIHFEGGETVAAGQLLVELENARERADLAEAEANLAEAQRQFELARTLIERDRGTQTELERSRNAVAAAEARVALARAELERRRIVAPFAGRITRKQVSVGAALDTGDVVAVLSAIDPLRVSAGIPERYLDLVDREMELAATTPSFPDRRFGGRVVYISPEIDPATRTVRAEAEIDNPAGLLRPGQSLSVVATVGTIEQALSIPEQALILEGDRTSVYVVVEGKALRRDVVVGERGGGRAVITHGLEAGEQVVVTGIQKIFFPGMPVQVRNQPPSTDEAAAPGAE